MCSYPDFLPPKADLDGNYGKQIVELYEIFERDFIKRRNHIDNIPVWYDRRCLDGNKGMPEGFWHVTSVFNKDVGERIPDYRRAEKLPWARAIIENIGDKEITTFDYFEGSKDKGLKKYLWLHNYDYVLIFKRLKKAYLWVTAFHVWNARKIKKKYDRRQM